MSREPPPRRHAAGARGRREQVAAAAARLMSERGDGDFAGARRKAAQRLGFEDPRDLPDQDEIEAALRQHQRLFRGERQPNALRSLREAAVEAMRFFALFEPRLVGSVLDGTADAGAPVCLQLHGDDSTALQRFLGELRIPIDERSRRVALAAGPAVDAPEYRFAADGVEFVLTLLPLSAQRSAPRDGLDGNPRPRASLAELQCLLAEVSSFD
jgi:hypothetical protein